jgi:hypothetical protein
MQTSNKRRRLLKDIESEPFRSWVVLAKCGGWLAVIVLVTVIGAGSTDNPEIISRAKNAAPYAPQPAQQHRKQVFDERRARFARSAPSHNIASETSQRAAPLLPIPR